jgi:hypothetical protein
MQLLITLHYRFMDACQTIRNYPGIFVRMRRSMVRRVEACIASHGEDYEHLLYYMYALSHNSQIKRFRTHIDMDIFSCFGMWNSSQNLTAPFSYTLYKSKNNSKYFHNSCRSSHKIGRQFALQSLPYLKCRNCVSNHRNSQGC